MQTSQRTAIPSLSLFRQRRSGSSLLRCLLACLFLARSLPAATPQEIGPEPLPENAELWIKLDAKLFEELLRDQDIAAQLQVKGELTLRPLQDPTSRKAADWVQRLDRALRAADPQRTKAIPRPELYVVEAESENAFTTSSPVICLSNVSLKMPGQGRLSEELAQFFGQACPRSKELPAAAASSFIARFAALSGGCRLERETDDKAIIKAEAENLSFRVSGSCEVLELAKARGVGRVQGWYAWYPRAYMIDAITLTQGSLKLPEAALVAMIFHELGHYYAAHSVVPPPSVWVQWPKEGPAGARVLSAEDAALKELESFQSDCLDKNRAPKDPAACRQRLEGFKAQHFISYTVEDRADDWALAFLDRLQLDPRWLIQWLSPVDQPCSAYDPKDRLSFFAELSPRDYGSVHHTRCFRVKRILASRPELSSVSLKGAKQ